MEATVARLFSKNPRRDLATRPYIALSACSVQCVPIRLQSSVNGYTRHEICAQVVAAEFDKALMLRERMRPKKLLLKQREAVAASMSGRVSFQTSYSKKFCNGCIISTA